MAARVLSFTEERARRSGVFIVSDRKGYRFVDKDPVLYLFMEAVRLSGLSVAQIARESRVTYGTLLKWTHGKTRKPQHATLRAALRACGYDEHFVNRATGHVMRFKN